MYIFEVPDEGTAAATLLAAISPDHIKAIKSITLHSVEDAIEAMRKTGEATYRSRGSSSRSSSSTTASVKGAGA